ncbi:MAG: hypothetical protein PHI29_07565 [Gallionella sp.]|nr:hypothetical protein [Gallionella sp.]
MSSTENKISAGNKQEVKHHVVSPIQTSSLKAEEIHPLAVQPKRKVAILVTHGMGQQVPFESIDTVTNGLIAAAKRHGAKVSEVNARLIQDKNKKKSQRAEFTMRDTHGQDIDVHVYEGYWAPITEGNVILRDVLSFLYDAACNGIKNSSLGFTRWIFDRTVHFGIQGKAGLQLAITLTTLLSLIAINTVTTMLSGYKLLASNMTMQVSEDLFRTYTNIAGTYLVITLVFGLPIVGLIWLRKYIARPSQNSIWKITTYVWQKFMWLWLLTTIAIGLSMVWAYFDSKLPDKLPLLHLDEFWIPIWIILAVISWKIRGVLVQYMGDVAVYVDAHKVDRFSELRKQIKDRVFEQAKIIYGNQDYKHVALIGHSLGSVVTYDTLNALLNFDDLNPHEQMNVANRTKLLLTFGSPLDKTAFIFASHVSSKRDTRETLAATVQPLIQNYKKFRNFRWINIYAKRDIVSGRLDFYDDKENDDCTPARAVDNLIDEDALIPLASHNEYWQNPLLFDKLYTHL